MSSEVSGWRGLGVLGLGFPSGWWGANISSVSAVSSCLTVAAWARVLAALNVARFVVTASCDVSYVTCVKCGNRKTERMTSESCTRKKRRVSPILAFGGFNGILVDFGARQLDAVVVVLIGGVARFVRDRVGHLLGDVVRVGVRVSLGD